LRARGAELVGEVENYEDIYRLCYVRGPEGIIVELAEGGPAVSGQSRPVVLPRCCHHAADRSSGEQIGERREAAPTVTALGEGVVVEPSA
jgi:hypothetical protein